MKPSKSDVPADHGAAPANVHKIPGAPDIDDRRAAVGQTPPPDVEDRRIAAEDRRSAPRLKRLKGGQIEWTGGTPVTCVIRNISETGAQLEAHGPVPDDFVLVFDSDQSRYACHVMWRKPPRLGVEFRPEKSPAH